MPKEYFRKKGKKQSGGGPHNMKSYGLGKSPIMMTYSPLKAGKKYDSYTGAGGRTYKSPIRSTEDTDDAEDNVTDITVLAKSKPGAKAHATQSDQDQLAGSPG